MEALSDPTTNLDHGAPYVEATPKESTSSVFTSYSYPGDDHELESHHAGDNDEDAEMSDGGVQIDMGSAHAQQFGDETEMLDPEVISAHNTGYVAAQIGFSSGFLQDNDASEDSADYTPGEDTADSSYGIAGDDEVDDEQDEDEFVPQAALISDPMSVVSQQLQSLQDGQEDYDFQTSAMLHGSDQHHSITSFSSFPQFSELLDDQDGLPALDDAPSAAYQGGGPAPWFPLGMTIAGQGIDLGQVPSGVDGAGHWDYSEGDGDEGDVTHANTLQVDDAHTLDLRNFLYAWVHWSTNKKSNSRKKRKKEGIPNIAYLNLLSEHPAEIGRSDLNGDACDFQGLDWTKIEVDRKEARRLRLLTYKNYTNVKIPVRDNLHLRRSVIKDGENYFMFRRMNFRPKINLSHFQLRNLIACTSRNNVYYAGESKVHYIDPLFDQEAIRMDLTDPVVQPANPVIFPGIQISTIAADHNVLVTGGFCGEYGMIALDSPPNADHTEGLITTDLNPITNHVQVHLNRHSGLPQASFASNDTGIRTLDCTSNKIVSHHKYEYAVNCSAISPDHRLRVVVGDHRNVIICDAEKGTVLQDLSSHTDYGFACAWADNGWHVATGNQDKMIKIWDARMWTDGRGFGKPIETVACTLTGARSLRFSPLGSGKRVLVAAEAADMVSIIDAEAYKTKQSFDLFGEISGVDFTPDGETLFVGITDSIRGGIMEFERCGSGGLYGLRDPSNQSQGYKYGPSRMELDDRASGLDWKPTDAEVVEDPRSKRTATYRQRKAAQSWNIGPF